MELRGKTILVTGATGLIGNELVKRLVDEENASVIAMGRDENKIKTVFHRLLDCPNFSYVVHDVMKPFPDLKDQIDGIFHAAGPISGTIIKSQPVNVLNANISGILNCMEYLKTQKDERHVDGRLIVFSSATVYSNLEDADHHVTEKETQYAEALDTPNVAYSEAKRLSEVYARAYLKQYGVDCVIARIGYVYGYCPCFPDTAFYEFIRTALEGKDIELNNSGLPRRDNIYVEDAVDGLLHIFKFGQKGEAYNISSNGDKGNFAAIDEIAGVIAETVNQAYLDYHVSVIFQNDSIRRASGVMLDNGKAKNLGWTLKTSLKEGIARTIHACKELIA